MPSARIKENYNNGVTDEFLIPFVVVDGAGKPVAQIRDEDVCINFNFRADRARADYPRADARERTEQAGRTRPGWLGGARRRQFPAAKFRKTSTTCA